MLNERHRPTPRSWTPWRRPPWRRPPAGEAKLKTGHWRQWTRSLRERFAAVTGRRWSTPMIYRGLPTASRVDHVAHHQSITRWAPRWQLTLRPSFTFHARRHHDRTVQRFVHHQTTTRPEVLATRSETVLPPRSAPARRVVIQHTVLSSLIPAPRRETLPTAAPIAPLMLARQRLEHGAESVRLRAGRRLLTTADLFEHHRRTMRRVERVEARSPAVPRQTLRQAPAAVDRPSAPAVAAMPAEGMLGPTTGRTSQRMTPPAVDVGMVTDAVMRKIDHRLNAWRERTGRI